MSRYDSSHHDSIQLSLLQLTMDQQTVNTIRKELLSNERKLEESMAHTREISKLITIIERAIKEKEYSH